MALHVQQFSEHLDENIPARITKLKSVFVANAESFGYGVQMVSSLKAAMDPSWTMALAPSQVPKDNPFFRWMEDLTAQIWTDPVSKA